MGGDKAFADFAGVTLLDWVVSRLAPGFRSAFIVAKDPGRFRRFGLPVVADVMPESVSAVGVYTALLATPTERVLCLACDMPFVTPRLLRCLATGSEGHDVFVPRHGPYLQPLCAVYARSATDAFAAMLDEGERRIDRFYTRVDTGYLEMDGGRFGDPDDLFANVNTPEELRAARRRVAAEPEHRLAPRIRAFTERVPVPVVSFVGKKKSGKTSVLLGVVGELVRRGYRVAVVKHDVHGFEVDVPGTDSYRLRMAGATVTGVSSPEKYVWIVNTTEEPSLERLAGLITEPVDLLISEGFKRQDAPKIEVSRRARSTGLIADEDELLGIVSDQSFPTYRVPQLTLDDIAGICDLLEAEILGLATECRPRPAAAVPVSGAGGEA